MARGGEKGVGGAGLHDFARVHDADPVGDSVNDPHVVGDEQKGRVTALSALHEIQHLGLERGIQGGGRFVGDDERGVEHEGGGDHHALLHAAGKLVGKVPHDARGLRQTDASEPFLGARERLPARNAQVQQRGLGQLRPDAAERGQRRHRILEDHGYLGAAEGSHPLFGELQEVFAAP